MTGKRGRSKEKAADEGRLSLGGANANRLLPIIETMTSAHE